MDLDGNMRNVAMITRDRSNYSAIIVALIGVFVVVTLRAAWISDDAMISFRTIRNLVDGYGLVWNVGERVQAFTHPLWLFVLTPVYWATRDFFFAIIAVNLIVSVLAVGVLATKVATTGRAAVLVLLSVTLSVSYIDYATSGLENGLTHLLLVLFFFVLLKKPNSRYRILTLSLLLSLVFLNRSDIILIVVPSYLLMLWRERPFTHYHHILVGAIPSVGWLFFSLFYFGFPFPNTAYAKLATGIVQSGVRMQGLLYILDSISTDPIILFSIFLAGYIIFIKRDSYLITAFIGVLLYLLYTVNVGGDFMAGRFLTAPFITIAIIISQWEIDELSHNRYIGLVGLVGMMGFLSFLSPVLFDHRYTTNVVNESDNSALFLGNGIANERAHYYVTQGLLSSTRHNRLIRQGAYLVGDSSIGTTCGGLGIHGLLAPPSTYFIDQCALSDPLLARLPPVFQADWRPGHLYRTIPPGYKSTILSGENKLEDPELAEYYDHLVLITQAPLLAPNRLNTIIQMNLGRFDHLIDHEAYTYPSVKTITIEQLRSEPSPNLEQFGVKIDFGELAQVESLLLNYEGSSFILRFFVDSVLVDSIEVFEEPVIVLGQPYLFVDLPESVGEGSITIHILPTEEEFAEPRLANVEPIYPVISDLFDTHSLDLLLTVYHTHYLRAMTQVDQQRLDALEQAILARGDDEWVELSKKNPALFVQLLETVRVPILRAKLEQYLNLGIVLTDDTGKPTMRLLAYELNITNTSNSWDDFLLRLYVEPLTTVERDYMVWLHVRSEADDTLQLYDRPLDESSRDWEIGSIYIEEWFLRVPQGSGTHTISFGFWDQVEDVRLQNQATGINWTDLPPLVSE